MSKTASESKPDKKSTGAGALSGPFADAMQHLDRDGLVSDCNNAVESAVQAVMATGGKATLTLTIKIDARGRNQVVMTGDMVKKLPRPKPEAVTLWAKETGELMTRDPEQPEFAEVVRIVDAPRTIQKLPAPVLAAEPAAAPSAG